MGARTDTAAAVGSQLAEFAGGKARLLRCSEASAERILAPAVGEGGERTRKARTWSAATRRTVRDEDARGRYRLGQGSRDGEGAGQDADIGGELHLGCASRVDQAELGREMKAAEKMDR